MVENDMKLIGLKGASHMEVPCRRCRERLLMDEWTSGRGPILNAQKGNNEKFVLIGAKG